MKHLRYLRYIVRHKWHVFLACYRLRIPWLGLVHDWSKLLPSEWLPYARYFYGDYLSKTEMPVGFGYGGPSKESVARDFDAAWLYHQHRNKHHWQFWVLREDSPRSHWTIQTFDQVVGPYWLAYENERIAMFTVEGYEQTLDAVTRTERALRLSECKVIPMPDRYRREMLADWRGAGMAIAGRDNTAEWYAENKDKMRLHPETRSWIETQLWEEG